MTVDIEDLFTRIHDIKATKYYWVAHVVSAYEGPESGLFGICGDHDPDGEGALVGSTVRPGPCYVLTEVIRDFAANGKLATGLAVAPRAKLEPRVVYHEVMHRFGLPDSKVATDGIMNYDVAEADNDDASIALNPAQLDVVRHKPKPE